MCTLHSFSSAHALIEARSGAPPHVLTGNESPLFRCPPPPVLRRREMVPSCPGNLEHVGLHLLKRAEWRPSNSSNEAHRHSRQPDSLIPRVLLARETQQDVSGLPEFMTQQRHDDQGFEADRPTNALAEQALFGEPLALVKSACAGVVCLDVKPQPVGPQLIECQFLYRSHDRPAVSLSLWDRDDSPELDT